MPKLPRITPKKLIRALLKIGFLKSRQKGSHLILRHPDGRKTVIAIHSGRNIPHGTLKSILRDLEISTQDFIKLLKK